jgi:tol-pal system protein YbgF
MIKLIVISLFIALSSHAGDRAKILPLPSKSLEVQNEDQYRVLKLESRVDELGFQLDELKKQVEVLNINLSRMNLKLNGLLSKEVDLLLENDEENISEFKYGFEALQKGDYDRSKRVFELFITKYPNDKKVGEAYFWLGEIAYKSENYKLASKNYLIAYRDYKDHTRQNDALYKLSISLDVLGQKSEACAGLNLLVNDKAVPRSLKNKAFAESKKIKCR